jgi:hypothetical protein
MAPVIRKDWPRPGVYVNSAVCCLRATEGSAGRSEASDDPEGAVSARTEEDGRLIVSCDEPGCERQFELRPLNLPQDTGNFADAVNEGWNVGPDESEPDFCPEHT